MPPTSQSPALVRVARGRTSRVAADRSAALNHPFATDGIHRRFAQATDRGLIREQNEDTIAIAEDAGLALVADGMGGYNAGEVASGLAADFLVTHLVGDLDEWRRKSPDLSSGHAQQMLHGLLRARVDGANDAIIDAANRTPEMFGMGTTLAMLLIGDDAVTTLHLGDSRVYRMRDGVLSLLTRDHSLLQEQIDAGVLTPGEARESINRNFVTRALGVDPVAEPEINEYDLVPGDLYLVCSDGLPDMLSDEEIFDLLYDGRADVSHDGADGHTAQAPVDGRVAATERLDEVAGKLIAAAIAHGGRDNVSVVLASVGWARSDDASGGGTEAGRARHERAE